MSDEKSCPINYVVVLMLENRSYDNVLGWLYGAGNAPPYDSPPSGQADLDGLTGSEENQLKIDKVDHTYAVHNPTSPTKLGYRSGKQYPTTYAATSIPLVDPGEYFGDMAQQILGKKFSPEAPYAHYRNLYAKSDPSLMGGFVDNYASLRFTEQLGQLPPPWPNLEDVMSYFTPAQLPVSAFLANNYGVCDEWFGSVPTQTYANRVFSVCAAPGILLNDNSYSLIDDVQYPPLDPPLVDYDLASIFSQLDAVKGPSSTGPTWKLYFHDFSIAMKTVPYVYKVAARNTSNENVSTFDYTDWNQSNLPPDFVHLPSTFIGDITASPPTLPPFSFIEPRYYTDDSGTKGLLPNSNHPGSSLFPSTLGNPPIDVVNGEMLLAQVYNLLRASSIWTETLLIVTYDEHGGMYDHVPPPPTAVPPGTAINLGIGSPTVTVPDANGSSANDPAANGFDYTVFGGRVPAIIISPTISPGSTIRKPPHPKDRPPFDHTSIIKTVWHLFNLSSGPNGLPSLTQRDAAAPSLYPFLLTKKETNSTGLFVGAIPTFLEFSSVSPAPQTLYVTEQTALTPSVPEGSDWLSITSTISSTTTNNTVSSTSTTIYSLQVTVTVNPGVLASGTYHGRIRVTGEGIPDIKVPVKLTVA